MSRQHVLPAESHTARRLEHAAPEHLNRTTLRTFVGPIPQGWLRSHRKEWYRQYIDRRAPTFTAAHPIVGVEQHDGPAESPARLEDVPPHRSLSAERDEGPEQVASTTSLLHSQRASTTGGSSRLNAPPESQVRESSESEPRHQSVRSALKSDRATTKPLKPRVRFSEASRLQLRARAQRLAAGGNFRSSKVKEGQVMKVDKMLVRTDVTRQSLREDYDEKISQSVETKSLDKWREFMVVCRKYTDDDAEAVLQLYQTRVIALSDEGKVKKKPKVQMVLNNRHIKVNMYSALDKTLCLWTAENNRTTIYYLRPQSSAAAVEWFTFLRSLLGSKRAQTLQVNVPDLSVSLVLDDPFKTVESSKTLEDAAAGDDNALAQVVSDETGAAGAIVARCVAMLKQSPEWSDVLKAWALYDRIGLAWKRYDRLEWVHGAVEQRMYGTIAMQRTHDLELRPKHHYPLHTRLHDGKTLEEPPPIEGFLIRLTSQTGRERRLGKILFKRLYFASHNHYLLFLRPAKANPPQPPQIRAHTEPNTPSAKALRDKVPMTYNVEPYPLEGKNIAWLDTGGIKSRQQLEALDRVAADEAERNVNMIMSCDGFINLCDVQRVRKFHKGAIPADELIDDGSDVDFHIQPDDGPDDDGQTTELDEDRVLELVMKNGLVIRLQAFNRAARNHWIHGVRKLVQYWSHRAQADMNLYKSTREQNLKELGIDERAEGSVGQFAYKWEVGKSFASPTLYNMCGIAECRSIHLSGLLFRKPRRHTSFTRCHVILAHGYMLVFQDSLRKRNGKKLVHIHHERIASISLKDCYLYSGLLAENDLLYQNRTFDSTVPGHHALPRIYLEDGWTSTDEDAMTTFVIWHAKSKAWFRSSRNVDDIKTQEASEDDPQKVKRKLTRVSQLGATGRSVVFKARSRAERDHWVLAIQVEIERLAGQSEEFRIVHED